jgi:small subunit ribosomal protein S2
MRSIELVLKRLADAVIVGRASAPAEPPPRADDQPQASGRGDRRGDRRGGNQGRGGPGIGSSRGLAARTVNPNPVLASTTEPGTVVEHGPEGTMPGQQIAESAPMGVEPQAGINDEPPPVEADVPLIAPAAVGQAHPGSQGQTDLPPSSAGPDVTLEPNRLDPDKDQGGQS